LVDFLSGNDQGVAINLGFIAGSHGFAKVAKTIANNGIGLIADGKVLLGRSLKAASPFLARGTSAFVVYDLVNQIKEYKKGNNDTLVGIIGDSIYFGVDSVEIGIEVAEAFEVFEGVSSFAGPIGAGIGAIVFVGTDIYMAVKRVDNIDKIVHLTGKEKFIEGLRAFVGMKPRQYMEELVGEKQANNLLVEQRLKFLEQHNDIQRCVFPTGKSVPDTCSTVCTPGQITGLLGTAGATKECREECTTKIQEDLNSTVLLDKKVAGIKWSRAKPDSPSSGELFCLPSGDYESTSSDRAYNCENAIGLANSANTGNYTLIDLGEGDDHAKGLTDSHNIFMINNGFKRYYGGDNNDIFILCGNAIRGTIDGGNGINEVDLENFAAMEKSVQVILDRDGRISSGNHSLYLRNINKVFGRKNKKDEITCAYNTKYVDARGGESNDNPDVILIPRDSSNSYDMQIVVRSNTNITNRASIGSFRYIVLPKSVGEAHINLPSLLGGTPTDRHNFFFNYTLSEVVGINVHDVSQVSNYTIKDITFSFLSSQDNYFISNILHNVRSSEMFNITISDIPVSASYVLGDNTEVKVGKKNLYAVQSTSKPVSEVIETYQAIADRLTMSLFIQASNKTVVIGHGNHDVINNDPKQESHLIGSGGENVYVITSDHETLDIDDLPIPEVVIYDDFNKKKNLSDTLDLRQLVKQISNDLSIKPIIKLIEMKVTC
jgi:hypothetical protein